MGGDEQLSFGGGGEVTNDGGSRPKEGEGPQKRGPEGEGEVANSRKKER